MPDTHLTAEQLAEAIRADDGEGNLCALAERVKAGAVGDPALAVELAGVLMGVEGASPRSSIRALAARAHALSYRNDFPAAQADLNAAAALAQKHDLPGEYGLVLLAQVQPFARVGELARAQATAEQAIELTAKAGLLDASAKGEVNLGIVRMMQGDAARAIACFDRALPVLGDNPFVRAMIQSNRAEALLELDRFGEAEAAFVESSRAFEAAGQAHAAAVGIGNRADLLSRTGRVDEAVLMFEEARARLDRLGAKGDALRLLAEQAESLASVGAARASLPLFAQAVPGLDGAGLKRELARAALGHGLALLRAGDASAAREALLRAERVADSIGAAHVRAEAQIALAEVLAGEGDLAGARAGLEQAAAVLTARPVRLAALWASRAGIDLQAGDAERADEAIRQAECALGDIPVAPLQVRLAHLRGRWLMSAGRHGAAAEVLSGAVHRAEAFRGAIRAEMVRVSYLESAQQLYLDAAHAALEAEPHAGSAPLELIEHLRQRSLLDAQPLGETESANTPELNALYALLGPSGRAAARPDAPDPVRITSRLRQLEQEQAHRSMVSQSARTATAAQPLRADVLQSRMPAGSLYVSLFPDGDALSCILLSDRGLKVRRGLTTQARWQMLSRRFDMALARACSGLDDRDACRELAAELAGLVLGPIEPDLADVRRLMLAPFGVLHAMPLLVAWPWAQQQAVWHVPSATFALAREAKATSTPRVLVVGVSDEAAPRAESEARDVGRCWPGSLALLGADATPGAVLSNLGQADVVHFAGHAVFDAEFPASSRLMFAGGWVTARQIAGAIKPGAVVVLAGCSTARAAAWGEDRQGLVRAVLGAGARAVIASQWQLHDQGASQAVLDLHAQLADAGGIDLSMPRLATTLRAVQLRAAQQGRPFHHWAGLTLIGGAT